MSLIRIQRTRRKGFKLPQHTVCISRPSHWGNPFVVTQTDKNYFRVFIRMKISPGDCATLARILTQNGPAGFVTKHEASGHAAKLFGKLMEAMPANYQLSDFDGVDYIACFCKEGEPCHGDVIIEAYNKYHAQK